MVKTLQKDRGKWEIKKGGGEDMGDRKLTLVLFQGNKRIFIYSVREGVYEKRFKTADISG